MSSKQLHEVCGLRPDAGAGGIFEGLAHGRGRLFDVPRHACACGLAPWPKSRLGGASTWAKLVIPAKAVVDKGITFAQWFLQAAAWYLTIILYRHDLT